MNTEPLKSGPTFFYESVEREKPVGKLFVKWCWPAFFSRPCGWFIESNIYLPFYILFFYRFI